MSSSSQWRELRLGQVCFESVDRAGTLDEGTPIYGVDRTAGLTSEPKYVSNNLTRYKRLKPGMFAYNPMRLNIGSIGYCSRAFQTGIVSPDYVVFGCNTALLHAEYLKYYIGSPAWRDWVAGAGVGSVRIRIYFSELAGMPLSLPHLEGQWAIVRVLSTLDRKIELNHEMNKTLEAMAHALFTSWFVDFAPARRRMQDSYYRHPEGLGGLFRDQLVDSELGMIPQGWSIQRFSETVEVIGGGTPKTTVPDYWNGDIPWFSVGDAPTSSEMWVLDTEKKVTKLGVESSSTRILPIGTTILSARGTVGRVALVAAPMAMNQSCYALRGKQGSKGLFNYYSTRNLVGTLKQHVHGSVFDTITRNTLDRVSVVVPPSRLVDEFERLVAPLADRILLNRFQSRTLATLRDTLLPKLISGELRIKDAERRVSEVV